MKQLLFLSLALALALCGCNYKSPSARNTTHFNVSLTSPAMLDEGVRP